MSFLFCQQLKSKEFIQLEWTDLLPAEDYQALLEAPEVDHSLEPGQLSPETSETDEVAQIEQKLRELREERFAQAMTSTRIKSELELKNIRIPGFIVPLEFMGQQKLSEFFLVPYFGACMHLPPPPPNQIIHIKSEQGVEIQDLYSPYWISGQLKIKQTENEVASSAYAMSVDKVEIYED